MRTSGLKTPGLKTPGLKTPLSFRALDAGLVPDALLRAVCTARVANRLRVERRGTVHERSERFRDLVSELRSGKVATHTDEANDQHYEVPTGFYTAVLGARLKYSSCYWPDGVETLDEAEEAMLALYAERAELVDGQRVLELGCGWGSLCLWIAEHHPRSEIVALSNSRTQRTFIETRAAERGFTNLRVITDDVSDFDPADHGESGPFDRVVSVEMLEHISNHGVIFERIASWLADDGAFFTHVFTGRDVCFRYDADNPRDWMGRYFFSGGLMPSDDLFLHLQDDLVVTDHWVLGGRHYERTANAWIANLEANRDAAMAALAADGGGRHARVWMRRWKAFFIGCAQLWGHRGGADFTVSHYLFRNTRSGYAC